MPIVELPSGQEVEFPDGMSNADMVAAIRRKFPEYASKQGATAAATAAAPAEPGLWERAKNAVGEYAGSVVDTVAGIPDALAEAVATPNKDGVMGAAAARGELGLEAVPKDVGPFSREGWARVKQRQADEPLDPRLAAIKPGDAVARAEQEAAMRPDANAANRRVTERAPADNMRAAAETAQQDAMYSAANLAGNTADNLRNTAASVLKIGPTAIKGGADISRLFTGDSVGVDTSELMARGMKGIDRLVASEQMNEQHREFSQLMANDSAGVGDLFEYLIDNPAIMMDAGITTIGSMFAPAGAAKLGVMGARALGAGQAGVSRAAMGASGATVAAQNAGDTFTDDSLANSSMEDRYKAATVSAALTVLSGMAFKGGAEGEIAKRMAGELKAGRTTVDAVKGYIKAALNEGAQEAGEELGSIMGKSAALLEAPNMNSAVKQLAFAGTLGAMFGAGTHATSAGVQDDGSAAAERARQDALGRWNNDGLAGSRASGNAAPTWQEATSGAIDQPERREPSLDDIANATSVDAAIAAATALASAPTASASPYPTAAEIDALEEGTGLLAAASAGPRIPVNDLEGIDLTAGIPDPDAPAVWRARTGKELADTGVADLPPGQQAAPALDVAGKKTPETGNLPNLASSADDSADWHPFPPESQTLGLPRAEMPQIKAEHRGAMVNFLNARGIMHEQVDIDANDLKPTQREFSISKVQKAIDYEGGNRSILVSSDGHVLDGHHQWLASAEKGEAVKAIRLNAPIAQLLETVREFPSAGVDTASEPQNAPQNIPKNIPETSPLEAARAKHQRQDDAVRLAAENIAKRKSTGGQRARDRLKVDNPFLGFLASHGVAIDERADTGGEKGRAGGVMVPGYGPLYRKSGKRLDELATLAQEAGFLTQQDIDEATDTGGTRKLADMIQRAVQGKEVIRTAGLLDAVAPTADQRLTDEARRFGISTDDKNADQLYDEVRAAHEAEEGRREATGAASVDEQAEIERLADWLTERQAQMALDAARDADIPLDGATPSTTLESDEELDAIFGKQSRGARADAGQAQEDTAEAANQGAARAGPASEGEGQDLLSSYSPEEVLEREAAARAAEKDSQAEADRLERERRADQLAREKGQRIAGTVDDFQLGQSAEEALAGQRSIFDVPAPRAKQPEMERQDFDSAAGVGKISAVKERYGDKFGVSWASTSIATADTMEQAAAIAREVAESGADNIADMRKVAAPTQLQKEIERAKAQSTAERAAKDAKKKPAAPADDVDDLADIPRAFLKKVRVPMDVYIEDESRWESVDVTADKALKSVNEDITNLEAMLKCMKG